MSDVAKSGELLCPHCGNRLCCNYYLGKHIIGCERCGLRGPVASDDGEHPYAALALYTEHCTHSPELASAREEAERLRTMYRACRAELFQRRMAADAASPTWIAQQRKRYDATTEKNLNAAWAAQAKGKQ